MFYTKISATFHNGVFITSLIPTIKRSNNSKCFVLTLTEEKKGVGIAKNTHKTLYMYIIQLWARLLFFFNKYFLQSPREEEKNTRTDHFFKDKKINIL